ncbi:MAG: efflux RND transporter periplasmic adaptor subunit [Fimbriimonas sp.]
MIRFLIFLLALSLTTFGFGAETRIGSYRVTVVTNPPTIPVGRANLVITVRDGAGKPVSGAQVKALAGMPGMNMGEREQAGKPGDGPGQYVAPAAFPMAGLYEVVVTVNGQSGIVEMRTGENTADESRGGVPILAFVLAAGIALIVIVFARRSKSSLNVRGILTPQVLGSLVLLGAAIGIAVWAVNTQRRPGSMTPIEAQVMEMNMPAPEGTLPVTLAKAEARSLAATVTYTGQAVGNVEQDLVPRVGGTIEWMPFYVGDRVKKGQLLARLDTSQLDPEVAMRSASVGRAQQGVGVASLEYREALSGVSQARAEVGMAQGDLAEARAMLQAAQEGRGAATAELQSAQAEVDAMTAEAAAAEAERTYMGAELARMQELLDKGAVSRDEFQRAKADAEKAGAMARQASERVRKARSMTAGARAGQRRVEAEIAAARRRVQQAEAGVRAKEASVRTATAGAEAARAKIAQEQAMVRESAAGLRGAATQRGYAQLKAETDGVIVARLISPGQVVAAGQAVLRIAQISPIRLQANVPEADLARVREGATVQIVRRGVKETPLTVRVTTVSPALDPSARTGVVEAIYSNPDGRFRPGQFVTMAITVGSGQGGVAVPAEAVEQESESGEAFVWVAEPGTNGEFEVRRQRVTVGDRDGERVAIREGVAPGQQVVVAPPQGLREGTRVTTSTVPDEAPLVVAVTERGFEPASLAIPANRPVKITFIRKVDPSCGDTLVFPELKRQFELPFNRAVVIDLPARPAGELKFVCGMDMYRGKLVVR